MGEITIAQIGGGVALIAGIITGGGIISGYLAKVIKKWMSDSLEPISQKLLDLEHQISDMDSSTSETLLVRMLSDIEAGKVLSEIQMERLYEIYARYCKKNSQNYICAKFDELRAKKKI